MTTGPLLLAAAIGLTAGVVFAPRAPRLSLALTLFASGAAASAALLALGRRTPWEWHSPFAVGGERLHLRLDGISALFLVLLCVIGAAGAVYAREYWSDQRYPASAPRGRMWWSGLILSMGFVLVSSNGLHFLIGWELFTLCAYFLITLDRQQRATRAAGWLYLVASHVGTVCLFAFFAMMAARTGSWDLGPMNSVDPQTAKLAPLFWLALVGFGVKGGVFPLHVWLPSAHANAPSHVSAILSGVAIKMGIYGIVRFSGWLPVPPAAGWVVISLGSIGAVLGIALALAQNDLKRLLAYCSVENVGVIMIGLGAAMLGVTHGDAPWGRLALAGALLHIWNHGLFKSLLFFGAGSVLHATGTREMSRLGGLWRAMPWTAGLFALGAIAISGLPPLNGFVSEWLVYLGLFDVATSRSPAGWAAIPAAIFLGITGALALATFAKAGAVVFLGAPRTKSAAHAHECGPLMRAPMLVLAGVCVAIGLAPVLFWPAVINAIDTWHPEWSTTETSAPVGLLGPIHVALAAAFMAGAVWLWRRAHAQGLRRGLTWDCGYAGPTPRMQYTSGSFADVATGWFSWALQPVRTLRRPRGPFPQHAGSMTRLPDPVLAWAIAPLSGVIMNVSSAVRRLQHGRLQFYIVYVLAGIAGLGLIVLLEGTP